MATTTQNFAITKGTEKVEVFDFSADDYSKFQFIILNSDGSIGLSLEGTSENDNWQLDVTDLDVTATIQDSDTRMLDVGSLSYSFSALNTSSGEWEKLFAGTVTVSASSGGGTTPTIWREGRLGIANKPITDLDPGVDYDIVKDSLGGYYIKKDSVFSLLGETEYETNEHLTAQKWVDGKPIYARIITSSPIASAGNASVAHGITGLENVIEIEGFGRLASPLTIYNIPTKNIEIKVDATNVTITNGEAETLTFTVVLWYTKAEE